MDINELTAMAFSCIIYAQEVADVLKTEFGAACREFKTEDEYLLWLLKHVRGIKRNPREYLIFPGLHNCHEQEVLEQIYRLSYQKKHPQN